jgi:hypothetical protein
MQGVLGIILRSESGIKSGNRTFKMDQLTLYYTPSLLSSIIQFRLRALGIRFGQTVHIDIYLTIISSAEDARRSGSDDKGQRATRS